MKMTQYCNACTFQYNEHLSPVDPESTNASKVQHNNNKETLTTTTRCNSVQWHTEKGNNEQQQRGVNTGE